MLPFSPERSVFQTAKCYFSHGTMGHIDPAQLPAIDSTVAGGDGGRGSTPQSKRLKKPWANLQALRFVRQLDLVLPQEAAAAVQRALVPKPGGDGDGDGNQTPADGSSSSSGRIPVMPSRFARVVMTLGQVLEGAFFTEYIKAGNILMLSRGRPGQDNVFTLKDGRLTLFLERETYERAGLVGKPHGVKGNRGLRPRWVVEFDLNAKSMWPGKSGFDRLLYACHNVLNTPVTWLFYNLFDTPSPDPLAAFSPMLVTAVPTIVEHNRVALPPLGRPACLLVHNDDGDGPDRVAADEAVVALYEWLALVRLGSPRVAADDRIDPYLSRYHVPRVDDDDDDNDDDNDQDDNHRTPTGAVCTLRWRGFFPAAWACQTLLAVLLALPSSHTWCALSASGFAASTGLAGDGAECTFFRPADAPNEYLLWDVHGHDE